MIEIPVVISESFFKRSLCYPKIKLMVFVCLTIDISSINNTLCEALILEGAIFSNSTVIKQLPKSISKRLSDLSSNEEIFQKTKPAYSDALKKSGFQGKLSYTSAQSNNDKNDNKQRKRKIIWYNPPYSTNIKTNIGKTFLNLIKKHFPKTNKLHKIFGT